MFHSTMFHGVTGRRFLLSTSIAIPVGIIILLVIVAGPA